METLSLRSGCIFKFDKFTATGRVRSLITGLDISNSQNLVFYTYHFKNYKVHYVICNFRKYNKSDKYKISQLMNII